MKPLLDLPWRSCKWPVAERGGQHLFCAQPLGPEVDEKCFYCAAHEPMSRVLTKSFGFSEASAAAWHSRYDRTEKRDAPETTRDLVEEMGE